MMKVHLVFAFFLTVSLKCAKQMQTETTLPVQERIALLKKQIAKEIKIKQQAHEKLHPIDNHDFGSSYEYEDTVEHITPIMNNQDNMKRNKFRLKHLKTTTEAEIEAFPKKRVDEAPAQKRSQIKRNRKSKGHESENDNKTIEKTSLKKGYYSSQDSSSKETIKMKGIEAAFSTNKSDSKQDRMGPLAMPTIIYKHGVEHSVKVARHGNDSAIGLIPPLVINKKKHRSKRKREENIFYRRAYSNTKYINPYWVHCQDLISPFLRGFKTNMTQGKTISLSDNSVRRLLQLLSEDTSDDNLDDIFSLIYQISKVQIMLFQWETSAIKTLLNIIGKEQRKVHTFKTVKIGLRNLFDSWHLDLFGNTTNLLKQARVFRPPCVRVTPYEGSTKTSKRVRYTTSKKPKCSNEDGEGDDECDA